MTQQDLKLPIVFDRLSLDDNTVKISSSESCTSFFNIHREPVITGEELEALYKEVKTTGKKAGVEVKVTRRNGSTISRIRALKDKLPKAYFAYNTVFDKLVEQAKEVVEHGLYSAYRDDPRYIAACETYNLALTATNSHHPIGMALNIKSNLEDTLRDINMSMKYPDRDSRLISVTV